MVVLPGKDAGQCAEGWFGRKQLGLTHITITFPCLGHSWGRWGSIGTLGGPYRNLGYPL
jgi:hypothetical protein